MHPVFVGSAITGAGVDPLMAGIAELETAIMDYLEQHNASPKPFVWTATVESIVAKLSRCRQTLEQIKPGCDLEVDGGIVRQRLC